MESWKIDRMKRIADVAIKAARADMARGTHVIDMGDDVKAEGITGYMARQIDGNEVDGRTSAQVELQSAMRQVRKLGMVGKQLQADAVAELEKLEGVWDELKLDEEE
jgi:hypothetical protein